MAAAREMAGTVARQEKTICFDVSKREIFTPSSGLKALRRRLQSAYKVTACAARPCPRLPLPPRPSGRGFILYAHPVP